ncbi:MAG TPA: sigma 54-dependent Fis family transcriptional regulator [Kofleriaceae bacterium]
MSSPSSRLRVVTGPDAGLVVSLEEGARVTIGTAPDNVFVLSDPQVSRYHLELRRTRDDIAVDDLHSRSGTFVGDIRVERVIMPVGTRLRVGETVILIEVASESDAVIPELIGNSDALREIGRRVRLLAPAGASVLIEGETGVGKEVVARAIHAHGPRRDEPFIVVDCGSMPTSLIDSLLLGHEKGAFTGADDRRIGAFERAHRGTLLLDEIGELPLELQPALLGVLERRRFCRIGGSQQIAVDVRVLASTHRDLRAAVDQGRFRADLYFRLAVARVTVPPLRERPEDIDALVAHFVEQVTKIRGDNPLADALPALRQHAWPGNVRELRNVVEAALVMGRLPLDEAQTFHVSASPTSPLVPYREARARALAQFQVAYLTQALAECDGDPAEAARRARMARQYLVALLRKNNLRSPVGPSQRFADDGTRQVR